MESIHRFSHRLLPISTEKCFRNPKTNQLLKTPLRSFHKKHSQTSKFIISELKPASNGNFISPRAYISSSPSLTAPRAGWFLGLGDKKPTLPDIVKAGDPVLHEPARDVPIDEIGSEKIQKIIDDMIGVMRKAPGVGVAAPQIGVPLKIIVLEDTKEYISYVPKKEIVAQDRRPFDLLVILNPMLQKKNNKTAMFFEGCLSVNAFGALVERHLEVEVTGLDRDGLPIKVDASGWQARILQHECDHLDGTIYVDKMVPKTFRTIEHLDSPLPSGCPRLGVYREIGSLSRKKISNAFIRQTRCLSNAL